MASSEVKAKLCSILYAFIQSVRSIFQQFKVILKSFVFTHVIMKYRSFMSSSPVHLNGTTPSFFVIQIFISFFINSVFFFSFFSFYKCMYECNMSLPLTNLTDFTLQLTPSRPRPFLSLSPLFLPLSHQFLKSLIEPYPRRKYICIFCRKQLKFAHKLDRQPRHI